MATSEMMLAVTMVCIMSLYSSNGLRVKSGSRNLPSKLCQQLFDADSSDTFVNGKDYTLNIQRRTYRGDTVDRAPRKLFTRVNETKLRNKRTFSTFIALLDNYILRTGTSEVLTNKEREENRQFINAIVNTNTMKAAHKYLVSQGLGQGDLDSFKTFLYKLWLYFYRRGAYRDSSSFEHVFVGEITGRSTAVKLGGFHSWLEFYLLENASKVNYEGYHSYVNSKPSYLALRMSMGSVSKPYGGFFVGTSPQFEVALYTVCFLKFPDGDCNCKINSRRVKITTYKMRGTSSIGTAYPSMY